MTNQSARPGFTMLTVLWILGTAGVIATTALVAGRNASGAARNRVEWTRARWRALGCARRAQRSIDSVLSTRWIEDASIAWRRLDVAIDSAPMQTGCALVLEAAGTRLDVNSATGEMLERFFAAVARGDPGRLALDVIAMRDSAPIPDVRALRGIAGDVDWPAMESYLTVEPGRIALATAPLEVLQAIPGFSPEVAAAVVAHRSSHGPVSALSDVLSLVSRTSGRDLEERFQDASRAAVADPDAWLLRSTSYVGRPPIAAVVEWRLTRQANHVVIARSVLR